MCFTYACMDATTQLEMFLHDQTQLLVNTGCIVGIAINFLAR